MKMVSIALTAIAATIILVSCSLSGNPFAGAPDVNTDEAYIQQKGGAASVMRSIIDDIGDILGQDEDALIANVSIREVNDWNGDYSKQVTFRGMEAESQIYYGTADYRRSSGGTETLSLDFIIDENENIYSVSARNLPITRDSLSYITLSGTVSCNGKAYKDITVHTGISII